MKIIQTKVLDGPNYWSIDHKRLIVFKIDMGNKHEGIPTNSLNFGALLEQLIPSLFESSDNKENITLSFLQECTNFADVIAKIALELQILAGMKCTFAQGHRAHEKSSFHVIFEYEIKSAGLYAGHSAVEIAHTLSSGNQYKKLKANLLHLKTIFQNKRLGPSTCAIFNKALEKGIPVSTTAGSIVLLGYGVKQKKISTTITSNTSSIGVDIAADKQLTKKILFAHSIPVPKGVLIDSEEALDKAINQLNFPLVIKPFNGNHGRGITTNIDNREKALVSFNLAKSISQKVIVEQFIKGLDYRFLVINYCVVAVAKRTPAMVIGTGDKTIESLINEINKDPRRGKHHENFLTAITIDKTTRAILAEKNLSLQSVLPSGEILFLKDAANLSSGGTATDVTHLVHPNNIRLAERASRLIGLDICGLDVVTQDITKPITHNEGAIIEVNAAPGLRMHLSPNEGKPRDVASPIIDMLYPHAGESRIPLIAVTGTNGKTTVVRLVARMARQARKQVGFTTTDGIYLDEKLIFEGDCSGPSSAATILHDPWVDFAVLECARGGILRSGLGFDECDVSIITNITNDHLGLSDIHTMEELIRVKSVVAHSTRKNGFSLLNADDEHAFNLKEQLNCHIALFGLYESLKIKQHCQQGGLAAFTENNHIVVCNGPEKIIFSKLTDVPITFNGTATCMILNVLPAVLVGFIYQFSYEDIRKAIEGFISSPNNTPGRMNLFKFDGFQVMVDYAHNEGAFIEIKKYLQTIKSPRKIGIISATGDRRPQDIKQLGYHSAQMFDEIIIRHNTDSRGKTNEELTEYLIEGIEKYNPNADVKIISNEFEAIDYAMDKATPGTFIFYSVDDVLKVVDYMKSYSLKG